MDFQFSQGSLQDFVDCRRRFQLRYIQALSWPAIPVDPVLIQEQHVHLGVQFHRMVQQQQLGIAEETLSKMAVDPDLSRWWQSYLKYRPNDLPEQRYPEIVLSALFGKYRLIAKYDLIAVQPGARIVIVDWKTNRNRPKKTWLKKRLQTRVYRYLLIKTGMHLNDGNPLKPKQLEMVYWFAEAPTEPEHFPYDDVQFDEDEAYLTELIETIAQLEETEFPLTDQETHCRFCRYRSLCKRGVAAGLIQGAEDEVDIEADVDLDMNLEQIAEIEF